MKSNQLYERILQWLHAVRLLYLQANVRRIVETQIWFEH